MKINVKSTIPARASIFLILFDSDQEQENADILSEYSLNREDLLTAKNSTRVFTNLENNIRKTLILIDHKGKHTFQSISDQICQTLVKQKEQLSSKLVLDLRLMADDIALESVIHGVEMSRYEIGLYKSDQSPHPLSTSDAEVVVCLSSASKTAKTRVKEAQIIAHACKEVMDLVNAPGNKANVPFITNWTRKAAKEAGFKVKILNKSQIEKKGLHALMAVNRGSEWDPAFVMAEYRGSKNKDGKVLGLVGKGVTFDTGGLSIKGHNNMHYMKSDMGGAGAVLGTITAVASLGWPIDVVAICPLTDNCIDADAIKPGDVINSYSTRTIEVINTDAEGRLILADALSYLVKNYEIDHIIDLATLTGSSVRTFGTACAALFSNDDELSDNLIDSGMETGEKVWPLPIWDEYNREMQSDVADIKNLSTRPLAGAITAAKFLEAFIEDHPSWAHLDIAGMAFGDTPYGKDKAATGYGVVLLLHFIREHLL